MSCISELDTPSLMVDLNRLDLNIRGMQQVAEAARVRLRPHVKTHKSLAIAKKQLEAGATGITCAKISEAEMMSAVSDDVFIAFPIVGEAKLSRLDKLSEKVRTRISVESEEGARSLSEHIQRSGRVQEVMVKAETGLRRTGVAIEEFGAFLQALSRMRNLHVAGFFTHEGQAYGCETRSEIEDVHAEVTEILSRFGEVFVQTFDREPEISPGCTLTARLATRRDGITEMRPGMYVFADTKCVSSGMYAEEECALTVLVRIVSVKPDGRVVVDGGSKTFAMDRHPLRGHGIVTGHPDLFFDRLSEEHGVMLTECPVKYRVGDLLEVIPAHVCPVVNLHSVLNVRDGDNIVDKWTIDARGCVT